MPFTILWRENKNGCIEGVSRNQINCDYKPFFSCCTIHQQCSQLKEEYQNFERGAKGDLEQVVMGPEVDLKVVRKDEGCEKGT